MDHDDIAQSAGAEMSVFLDGLFQTSVHWGWDLSVAAPSAGVLNFG